MHIREVAKLTHIPPVRYCFFDTTGDPPVIPVKSGSNEKILPLLL
jgi:hypothetical protein